MLPRFMQRRKAPALKVGDHRLLETPTVTHYHPSGHHWLLEKHLQKRQSISG
jgi:hypothetical protein